MTKRARGKTMAAFMLVLYRLDRQMMGSRHYYDTSSNFAWMCVEALYVRADCKLSRFSRNIRQTTISRLVETCSPHVLESRSLSSERFPSLMKSAQGCLRKQSESQPTRSCLKRTKRSLLQLENVHGASSIEKLFLSQCVTSEPYWSCYLLAESHSLADLKTALSLNSLSPACTAT